MLSELLLALGVIPSMLFVYLVLTTFYGANRAYIVQFLQRKLKRMSEPNLISRVGRKVLQIEVR